jgi:hypothetical protein
MSNDPQFKPGQRVWARHIDAVGNAIVWDNGQIIDWVNSTPQGDIYRVTFGGFGLNFLIQETNLRPYMETSYGEKGNPFATQDPQDNARIQTRDTAQRQQERSEGKV